MPHFVYKAKQGPDRVIDGVIDAATMDEALEKLDGLGLLPIRMDEVSAETAKKTVVKKPAAPAADAPEAIPAGEAKRGRRRLFAGIKSSEVTLVGRQLATLLKAGVPILKALYVIADQTENPRLVAVLQDAQNQIRDGSPFSSVLERYPKLFPAIYVAMVRAGEDSGTLQEALLRVSEYRQKQEEILSRVRTAMAYPALMGLTGVGTVAFMLTFVIPRLSGLFSTMGGNLPMPTRILMAVSGLFQSPLFWGAFAALVLGAVAAVRSRPRQAKELWSRLSLRLPVFGDFVRKAELARFSRTLQLLMQSGIPILRSMEITTPVLTNTVLRQHFASAHSAVAGGAALGHTLKETGAFPLFMTNLITVGEESGNLEEALGELARYYERETDEAIKVLTSLLEPVMILVMGLVVGFIVVAMLLPMFELNMMVK